MLNKALQDYLINSECAASMAQNTISALEKNNVRLSELVSEYVGVATKIGQIEAEIEHAVIARRHDQIGQLLIRMTSLESECACTVTKYLNIAESAGDAAIELKLVTEVASKEIETSGFFS